MGGFMEKRASVGFFFNGLVGGAATLSRIII